MVPQPTDRLGAQAAVAEHYHLARKLVRHRRLFSQYDGQLLGPVEDACLRQLVQAAPNVVQARTAMVTGDHSQAGEQLWVQVYIRRGEWPTHTPDALAQHSYRAEIGLPKAVFIRQPGGVNLHRIEADHCGTHRVNRHHVFARDDQAHLHRAAFVRMIALLSDYAVYHGEVRTPDSEEIGELRRQVAIVVGEQLVLVGYEAV